MIECEFMDKLFEGYRQFRTDYYEKNQKLFETLAREGQAPKILLIGCSDSRVDPSYIFGAEPGDLFVLRNVANLVPPFAPDSHLHGTSAALEFAVRTLKVEHIIVMGHTRCGGVQALMDDVEGADGDFISGWMAVARGARERALVRSLSAGLSSEQTLRICEQEVVALSMGNLMSFPWIHEPVQYGRLQIHGLWFDVETGELFRLNPVTNVYEVVT